MRQLAITIPKDPTSRKKGSIRTVGIRLRIVRSARESAELCVPFPPKTLPEIARAVLAEMGDPVERRHYSKGPK